MKKIFTLMAMGLMAVGTMAQSYETRVLTFEDSTYVGGVSNYLGHTSDYWSSLIDSPQYGGTLLYGENHGDTTHVSTAVDYEWYDKNNFFIYSAIPYNYDTNMYWGGGHAISNYWESDIDNGDYEHQLSVYAPNSEGNGQYGHGHNGSDNFAVHFGYKDDSPYNLTENLPYWTFGEGKACIIDSMWINNTVYTANTMLNGNDLTAPLDEDSYVQIVANCYNEGEYKFTRTFDLNIDDNTIINEWTKWDWNNNVPVTRVEFNFDSDVENKAGISQAAYFAYDDVYVRVPVGAATRKNTNSVAKKTSSDSDIKTIKLEPVDYYDENGTFQHHVDATGDIEDGMSFNYESDCSGVFQLVEPGQTSTLTVSGLPANATITRLSAEVATASKAKGAGRMTAYINDVKVGTMAWCGTLSKVDADYGEKVKNVRTDLEFNYVEGASLACTGDIVIITENVEVIEKTSLSGIIDIYSFNISYTTGTTTGIEEFVTLTQDNTLYTLQGMRVTAPQKGQVYVKQGKKIVY